MTVPEPSWRRSRRDGYPMGGSTLVLKSTPSRVDVDLACTIEDGHGREVGSVQVVPSKSSGWRQLAQLLGSGSAASWEFVILRADRTPLLYVRRPRVKGWADRHERFELRDAWGRDVGRLLQNNGYLSGLRTFALQSGGKELGRTTLDDWQRVDGAFGENARRTVTILDVSDRVVAGITERRTTMQFIGNDFYDYTLEFEYPPYEPVGSLCLVVALAEFFHRRSEQGGMLRGVPGV
ncbi:hypothetical protein D8S82_21525 [Mycobacterium hodleri]|uniref:Scramblase n=1 Tax=Mycolicibacterium hodleri TaxID=49897 RepID=A0A544VWW7_9MYCO|nr:hypothetical protein [Mycolicibacterium hodleri]TQR84470.1 hypothetical protein D8S82_21525 [Mycolicibacterium hodleri]